MTAHDYLDLERMQTVCMIDSREHLARYIALGLSTLNPETPRVTE